jgi:hypothetical protein
VLWAEPAINDALFRQAMEVVGTPNLGATLHNKPRQPGYETLTPNQSVIYLYDIINLKDTGPVVHTAPAGPLNAGFFDMPMTIGPLVETLVPTLGLEPFEPFTFSPAGAAVYQLGPFGTAARKLKEWDLKP